MKKQKSAKIDDQNLYLEAPKYDDEKIEIGFSRL
jgi:hypothetical protein